MRMACLIKRCESLSLFNGDGQGDKFQYQVDSKWGLLLGPPWRAVFIRKHIVSKYVSLKRYSAGLSFETCSYYLLKLAGKDEI